MNPVIQGTTLEYTVLGLSCQATAKRPLLGNVMSAPPGVSTAHWTGLRTAIYQGHQFRTKCLSLTFWMVVFSLTMLFHLVFKGANDDENNNHNNNKDEDDTLDDVVFIVVPASIFVLLTLLLALQGIWHKAHVEQAVAIWKPKFRQTGWELTLTTTGRLFFVVGVLSLSASPYKAPPLGDSVV